VSAETRGAVESALSNLEGKLKGDDKAAIEAAMKELEKASMELGKIVYEQAAKQQQAQPETEAKPSGGGAKDDVIDAEFKVKDGQ
jgi:molecular chaperone DnaK